MFEKNMVLMVRPKTLLRYVELLEFYNIKYPFGWYSTAIKVNKYPFYVCFVKGEQVNLLAFPPVCLPSQGQSFSGMDGVVAGNS